MALSASTLAHERQTVVEHGFDGFIGKPFRFEQICRCLADLLAVEFTYAAEPMEDTTPADWRGGQVPSGLMARLLEATEFRQVTQLEAGLQELEQLGEAARRLAVHLRGLRQELQLDEIQTVLESL